MAEFRAIVEKCIEAYIEDLVATLEDVLALANCPRTVLSNLLSDGEVLFMMLTQALKNGDAPMAGRLLKELDRRELLSYITKFLPGSRMQAVIETPQQDFKKAAHCARRIAQSGLINLPDNLITYLESLSEEDEKKNLTPAPGADDKKCSASVANDKVSVCAPTNTLPQQRAVDAPEEGVTELERAVMSNDPALVEGLLRRGASANVRNSFGMSPLHWAAGKAGGRVVAALLEAGGDPGARDGDGCTPLHWAAWNGADEAADCLLRARAELEARDAEGCTPLHQAAMYNHLTTLGLLVARGACLNSKTNDGSTPLSLALKYQQKNAADYLGLVGGVK